MRSWLLNLLWKEYHELKWSVAAAVAIAMLLPLSSLVRVPDLAWGMLQWTFMVYPFLAGVLFGMRAAAGERGQRTAALLTALPIQPWKLGVVRLFSTLVAALIPVLLLVPLGGILLPWADADARFGWNVILPSLICAICTLHILLTVAAFGAGQPTEVRAAVLGMTIVAMWGIAGVTLHGLLDPVPNYRFAHPLAMAFCAVGPPLEWFNGPSSSTGEWWNFAGEWRLLLLPLSMLALATAFVLGYGRALGLSVDWRQFHQPIRGWTPSRLSSPLAALCWKQFRETLPWSLRVLGTAALLGAIVALPQIVARLQAGAFGPPPVAIMAATIAMSATLGGYALALLIGVGTFAPDLEAGVSTFWRSRPISSHHWFWSKFVIGFAALLVTLGLPTTVVAAIAVRSAVYHPVTPAELMWILLGWFGIYSAAVLSTCLVRHVLYASILAVGLVVASFTLVQFWDEALFSGTHLTTPFQDAAIWLIAACAAAFLAWQAATRDIALRAS